MDCIFCRIVRGEAPAWRVYEDEEFIAILDKYPATYGHTLIVSKSHFTNVLDTPMDLVARGFEVSAKLARAWMHLGARGVNILTNAGREAGQVIFHFHIHVIPRWGGPIIWHGREEIREEVAREIVEKISSVISTHL